MSPPSSESAVGTTSAWWHRVPLWVVWTFALALLFGAGTLSVVGPVLVEVWAVQTLRGIKGVTVDPDTGDREWGGPLVYALRHELFEPRNHVITFGPDVPREALTLLSRIRSVTNLFLYCRNLRDDDMAIVSKLPWLRHLAFNTPSLTADAFRYLEGHPVGIVEFHDMAIPAGTLATISRLPRLMSMTVAGTKFDRHDFAALQHHPRLLYLGLHRLELTDADIDTIGSLHVLAHLKLDDAGLTNEELARLPASLHLRSLTLIGKEFTDDDLAGLLVDPERLFIKDTRIEMGESTEAWLRSRTRCRKIELRDHGISPERLRYLNTLGPARIEVRKL
jgi:hypothetical protein